MSATDDLRRLLDERGVEYRASHSGDVIEIGQYIIAFANPTETTVDVSLFRISPEQAIAATLGRRTCHKLPQRSDLVCEVHNGSFSASFGYWTCSECGVENFDGAKYCMNCGAEAVE